jgi:hypothetical protein
VGEEDSMEVPGRHGPFILRGKAINIYKNFSSAIFSCPPEIPINEEVEIWGRRWIVKDTTLGFGCGLGVFACEDIHVPYPLHRKDDGVHLFPYVGSVYSRRQWTVLVTQHPSWKVYQLDMDSHPEAMHRPYHTRVIDGDPVHYGNIAGYINSTKGSKPKKRPNVHWVQIDGPTLHEYCIVHMDDHVMTTVIVSIRAGEELFCDYAW